MPSASSGSNSLEPPPLPPPDYTPISTEEWAKQRMPPLKGVIIDPEYPPTAEEALEALKKHNRDFDDDSLPYKNKAEDAPQKTLPNQQSSLDLYRKSGTSDILGRSASTDEKVNLMPGGTRHTAGGEKMKDVGVWDALTALKVDDFKKYLSIPCMRETWLYGLTAGFSVAGSLWVLGKRRSTITNGFMGSLLVTSTGTFEYCNYKARQSRQNVRLVKHAWEETRQEKKMQFEAMKARRQAESDKQKILEEQKKQQSGWRWWSGGGDDKKTPTDREG